MKAHMLFRGIKQIGHWWEPWNRGPFDRVLWQVKWENVFLRQLIRVQESVS